MKNTRIQSTTFANFFLKIGPNVFSVTAFMWACCYGHKDVVKLLFVYSEKIELNARNDNGRTTFIVACNYGNTDVVQVMLIDQSCVIIANMTSFSKIPDLIITGERRHLLFLVNMDTKMLSNNILIDKYKD